jgi:hypothetical protein
MHDPHHGNGARARSARIRADHDYEATRLESMRRRTSQCNGGAGHVSLFTRLQARLGRLTARVVDAPASNETVVAEVPEAIPELQ